MRWETGIEKLSVLPEPIEGASVRAGLTIQGFLVLSHILKPLRNSEEYIATFKHHITNIAESCRLPSKKGFRGLKEEFRCQSPKLLSPRLLFSCWPTLGLYKLIGVAVLDLKFPHAPDFSPGREVCLL